MIDIPPEELLPHRGNMILVKGIECADTDNGRSASLAYLDESCLFYDKARGGVPTEISIEIMAQGVGLLSGYRDYLQQKSRPGSAMLLSIKHYEVYCDIIPIHTLLRTTNEAIMEELPFGSYNCNLRREDDNTLLAKTEITVYNPHAHALHNS